MLGLALVSSLAVAGGPVAGGNVLNQGGSLGGVNHFQIEVGISSVGTGEAASAGITIEAITDQVAEALRKSGIDFSRMDDSPQAAPPTRTPGVWAELILNVEVVQRDKSLTVRLELDVRQRVRFEPDLEATGFATTWKDVRVVGWGASASLFRGVLSEALDRLCNEYLAARADWLEKHRGNDQRPR
jgi:hypothetical protein